ncbi:hypothetical protein, partial [Enterococcus faecium]|uniref:hypothetical protein n=1 Tax=Enterococcus faecium TaxID=1352 RepID=UPI003DA19BC7
FRTMKRHAISQLLCTGDVLEMLDDDNRLRVFRLDQYVTLRDSCGDIIYHITKERIDCAAIDDERLAKAQLDEKTRT